MRLCAFVYLSLCPDKAENSVKNKKKTSYTLVVDIRGISIIIISNRL